MKNATILLVCFVIATSLFVGCTREIQKSENTYSVQQPANGPLPDTTEPDWSKKTIQVTGQCATNPAHAGNPAQAMLMAKRGAIEDAKRNLLEQVLGVRIDSKTLIKDMVAQYDHLQAEVSGHIKEARIVGENFQSNIYTINMELKLYNIYTYMKSKKIYYD